MRVERRDFLTQILMAIAALFLPLKLLAPKPKPNFDSIALPLIRQVFPTLNATEFVTIQPMSLPSAHVFYMDYKYAGQSI